MLKRLLTKYYWVVIVIAITLFSFFSREGEKELESKLSNPIIVAEEVILLDGIVVKISYLIDKENYFLLIVYNDHSNETTTVILPVRGKLLSEELKEASPLF